MTFPARIAAQGNRTTGVVDFDPGLIKGKIEGTSIQTQRRALGGQIAHGGQFRGQVNCRSGGLIPAIEQALHLAVGQSSSTVNYRFYNTVIP